MNPHQRVSSLNPGRSAFDLSHEVKLTCDMGELIPIMAEETVPGDKFVIGNEVVIRFQPLVAPILHEINCYIHYFFVPFRLLWDDWEKFISGGVLGDDASVLPRWEPTDTAIGSLWDYFGFPTGVDPDGAYPMDFPKRAYNMIYNEFYRDETLIAEIDITTSEDVKLRAWEKDYFTAALPWQQRGTSPALPVAGITSAVFPGAIGIDWPEYNFTQNRNLIGSEAANEPYDVFTKNVLERGEASKANLDNNVVDLSLATTFDIADLRLAVQIQRWMERNARAGVRYTEFLKSHFGVSPRDSRLQRPEYIGGSKSPVIVSEVLQTSSSDVTTPQGNMAGHGLTADKQFVGKYYAEEYGVIIGIMSVMPRPAYQQGIERNWLRQTRYDFYFPEFANLSEQMIQRAEIYATGVEAENEEEFGYQGRYDELRVRRSRVCGMMRDTLDYWHLGRQFGSAPELNQSFIECVPDKRIFAVQDEDGLIVNIANLVKAIRPLPVQSDPGRMDH